MKRKIVIKVSVNCDKCRKKAMKVAAVADGVISVALTGEDKDRLEVIGVGVDAAGLTTALRKKACYASLETIEEIKPPPPLPFPELLLLPETTEGKDKKDPKIGDKVEGAGKAVEEGEDPNKKLSGPPCQQLYYPPICYPPPPPYPTCVVYDSYGQNAECTIL